MPYGPARPCAEPGCPQLTDRGRRCPEHARAAERRRGSAARRGSGAAGARSALPACGSSVVRPLRAPASESTTATAGPSARQPTEQPAEPVPAVPFPGPRSATTAASVAPEAGGHDGDLAQHPGPAGRGRGRHRPAGAPARPGPGSARRARSGQGWAPAREPAAVILQPIHAAALGFGIDPSEGPTPYLVAVVSLPAVDELGALRPLRISRPGAAPPSSAAQPVARRPHG